MVRLISTPRGLPATYQTQDVLKKSFYSIPAVTTEHLWAVYRGENVGHAIGDAGTILRYVYEEESWEAHANSGLVATSLRGIDISATSYDMVLVGTTGTLIRGTYNAATGLWTFVADPQSGVITATSLFACRWQYAHLGVGADRIIAVGLNGTILKYDAGAWGATTWVTVASPTTEHLMGISGELYMPLVACGYSGGIYKSDDYGNTWTEWLAAGELTSYPLTEVSVVSSTNVWVCGYYGTMLHYDGTSWSIVQVPTDQTIHHIYMIGEDEGYAVGDYGIILHWNGEIWSKSSSPLSQSLLGVHGISLNRLSIVGAAGTTLNYFGDIVPTQAIDRGGIVLPRPLNEEPTEVCVFTNEAIADALAHNSDIANMKRFKMRTIRVVNTLDQDVTIKIYQNRANSTVGAEDIKGIVFTVAALTGIETRTLLPETCGWMPFIYAEATAAGIPTLGNLNCYIIGRN
jgi:photosystem II stability/assembly factor-like uncharacterized protein